MYGVACTTTKSPIQKQNLLFSNLRIFLKLGESERLKIDLGVYVYTQVNIFWLSTTTNITLHNKNKLNLIYIFHL